MPPTRWPDQGRMDQRSAAQWPAVQYNVAPPSITMARTNETTRTVATRPLMTPARAFVGFILGLSCPALFASFPAQSLRFNQSRPRGGACRCHSRALATATHPTTQPGDTGCRDNGRIWVKFPCRGGDGRSVPSNDAEQGKHNQDDHQGAQAAARVIAPAAAIGPSRQ